MLKNETKIIQHQLADYCKSNHNEEILGVKKDRLHHYKRLIYNIIDDAIESAYPITRSILTNEQWKEMIDAFVKEHQCHHPQLFRMPGELIEFVQLKKIDEKFNLPHLIDALLFEWAEVEIHSMQDEELPSVNSTGDFLNSTIIFSPYCQLLNLAYPIHKLNSINIIEAKGEYFILVYREENGTVQYLELTALTYFLISNLSEEHISLNELLAPLLEEKNDVEKTEWYSQALAFINEMQSIGVVRGTNI